MDKLIAILVIIALVFIGFYSCITITTVRGNELGVQENWQTGVDATPLQPGTYFRCPWFTTIYKYDVSSHVFTMNDTSGQVDKVSKGREVDVYTVQSKEGQDMTIALCLQWHMDRARIVEIHKSIRNDIEEKLIRPAIMRIVKDCATEKTAIDAYSGAGLVALQKEIQDKLMSRDVKICDLFERGIYVENFVIEKITLDPKYVGEIKQKQVATQAKLKFDELKKQAEAEVTTNKAIAEAAAQTIIINAQRDKTAGITKAEQEKATTILQAEADSEKAIIAAKADKEKLVLTATGQRDADLLKAQAIIAVGEAEAKAQKLKFEAYNVSGSDNYVRMQIAESMAKAYSGIKGYLPEKSNYSVLSSDFVSGTNALMGMNMHNAIPDTVMLKK